MPKRRLELRGENTYRKARIVFLSYHQMGGGDAHKCTTHTVTRERPRRRLWYMVQAGCALVARLLAAARVFEIAVKAGYVSC